MSPELAAICEEFGLVSVPCGTWVRHMQTRAAATLESLITDFGAEHCRLVVMTLAETGNGYAFGAPVLLAVSDVLLAHPEWMGSRWFEIIDKIDFMDFWGRAKVGGAVPPRQHIAALLCEQFRLALMEKPNVVA